MADRHNFLKKIRQFFWDRSFTEVETPYAIPAADPSPHLSSFRTGYRDNQGRQLELFMHTSPEFAMKRLVAAGYERIFQICKFFRNGEISVLHNPEFTGLEWYMANADYRAVMSITEEMILALCPKDKILHYRGHRIDLTPPWLRMTVHEAIERYTGCRLPDDISFDVLRETCHKLNLNAADDDQWDDLFFKIFITYVEPQFIGQGPIFIIDYPIQIGALARAKPGNHYLAERVELYIAGIELANGYSELTDAAEQRRRWQEEVALREANRNPCCSPLDPGLLNALEWGMPPTAGIAVGLDRILMLLRDAADIRDVLPFPLASCFPERGD